MDKKTYVVGHRNPDTDSVASAIAYAELKGLLGEGGVVAAIAGEPNPQTAYILARLGIDPPVYLADVHLKVRDVLIREPVAATTDMPILHALELLHRNNIRVLPVVDAYGKPCGIASLLKLSEKYLLTGKSRMRGVDTTLRSLAVCLEGTFLCGVPADEIEHLHLFIGAMLEESFNSRISVYAPESLLIITGDRGDIQKAAIDKGVRLLVVAGGLPVPSELLAKAEERGVTVISTPFDTASAAWLTRLSTPIGFFAETEFERIGVAEPLSHLRIKLLHSGEPAVIAVEDDGTMAGVATKSSLLAPVPFSLILVDHNELSQAVPGAEEVEIREIIDHHKLGNSHTNHPVTFISAPVGSTCTLVAAMYRQECVELSPQIAALLLAGILSDTVILKSPTTTDRDRETALWLESQAGLNFELFGKEIFSSSSRISSYGTPEKVITSDFKVFSGGSIRFGVGQVEVVGFDEFYAMRESLQRALTVLKQQECLEMVGLMVTDINTETTLFLAEGYKGLAHVMGYPQIEPNLYELKGFMSRKKQMVPHLINVLGKTL